MNKVSINSFSTNTGFEHHAHEVTVTASQSLNKIQNTSVNNTKVNGETTTKLTKISKKNENKSLENLNKSSKAKKKLCMIAPTTNASSTTTTTLIQQSNLINNCNQNGVMDINNNIQLKPIKHKRDALPMRLSALPQSFWQQPNQSNVSPGSMYLPPLFKHDSDDDGMYEQLNINCFQIKKML